MPEVGTTSASFSQLHNNLASWLPKLALNTETFPRVKKGSCKHSKLTVPTWSAFTVFREAATSMGLQRFGILYLTKFGWNLQHFVSFYKRVISWWYGTIWRSGPTRKAWGHQCFLSSFWMMRRKPISLQVATLSKPQRYALKLAQSMAWTQHARLVLEGAQPRSVQSSVKWLRSRRSCAVRDDNNGPVSTKCTFFTRAYCLCAGATLWLWRLLSFYIKVPRTKPRSCWSRDLNSFSKVTFLSSTWRDSNVFTHASGNVTPW